MRHCTHCGISTDPDWHFCRTCGTPVDIERAAHRSTFCTECSHPLARSWRFCSRCGTPTPTSDVGHAAAVPSLEGLARSDVGAIEGTETPRPAGQILIPEIVEEPEIELISRRSETVAPPDAPTPPPSTVPPAPIGYPPERKHLAASPAERTSGVKAKALDPAVRSAQDRGDEPPISIYSSDSLDSEAEAREDLLRAQQFRDPTTVASLTRAGLIIVSLLAGWLAVGLHLLNNRIIDVAAGRGSVAQIATAETLVNERIGPALAGAAAITGVGLMLWSYRVGANARSFDRTDVLAPPRAATVAWLVPGVNLVFSVLLLNDVWRASDVYTRADPYWNRRPGNRWLIVFVIGIGASFAVVVASLWSGRLSFQAEVNANRWLMVGAAGLIIGCIGLAQAIATITRRQQTSLPHTPPTSGLVET